MRHAWIWALGLALGLGTAQAAETPPRLNPLGGASSPLPGASLAELRGGYQPEVGGLLLSFGITRSVTIDGSIVATTTLTGTGNLASITGTTAAVTLVQNAADGRKIQAATVIDASANSLGLMRQSNLQSSLRGAVIDSLRR